MCTGACCPPYLQTAIRSEVPTLSHAMHLYLSATCIAVAHREAPQRACCVSAHLPSLAANTLACFFSLMARTPLACTLAMQRRRKCQCDVGPANAAAPPNACCRCIRAPFCHDAGCNTAGMAAGGTRQSAGACAAFSDARSVHVYNGQGWGPLSAGGVIKLAVSRFEVALAECPASTGGAYSTSYVRVLPYLGLHCPSSAAM